MTITTRNCAAVWLVLAHAIALVSLVRAGCEDWQQALDIHNSARAKHGAGPLYWDGGLESSAQGYADYLADNGCGLVHSGGAYGENLYANYGYKDSGNCIDAANMWLGEDGNYRWTSNPWSDNNFGAIGHFSQMVWASTSAVGCGSAVRGSCVVVCCQYNPAGNIMGDDSFLANVLPTGSYSNPQQEPQTQQDPQLIQEGTISLDYTPVSEPEASPPPKRKAPKKKPPPPKKKYRRPRGPRSPRPPRPPRPPPRPTRGRGMMDNVQEA